MDPSSLYKTLRTLPKMAVALVVSAVFNLYEIADLAFSHQFH